MDVNCHINCTTCSNRPLCKYAYNFIHFSSNLKNKVNKIEPKEIFPISNIVIGCKYYNPGTPLGCYRC